MEPLDPPDDTPRITIQEYAVDALVDPYTTQTLDLDVSWVHIPD